MSFDFGIDTDHAGRPVVSATFLLARTPGPTERLRDLVTHAVVAVDLVAENDVAPMTRSRATVELPAGPVRAVSTGPFGKVSVSFTAEDAEAGDLLQRLVERRGGPVVRMEAMTAAGPDATRRVRFRLGRIWDYLDRRADDARVFRRGDLEHCLPGLVACGAVELVAQPQGPAGCKAVVDLLVRRAVGVLAPAEGPVPAAPDELGAAYRLSQRRPGDQEVTAMVTFPGPPGDVVRAERPLGELVGDAVNGDLAAHLNLVTADGGRLSGLLPSRALTGAKAGPGARPVMIKRAELLEPAALAVGGHVAPAVMASQIMLEQQVPVASAVAIAMFPEAQNEPPGPVVTTGPPAFWKDRFDDTHWYVPELTLRLPDPGQDAEGAPFLFDVRPSGHGLDGSSGLEATITVTLAAGVPADVTAAWHAAGQPTLKPVPAENLVVQLGVPFRDQAGTAQIQYHLAESITPNGELGADGSTVTAVFRLADQWARMAYGALSTPGFQAEPARVLATYVYRGWQWQAGVFNFAVPDKQALVLSRLEGRRRVGPGIAEPQVLAVAKAGLTLQPQLQFANAAVTEALWAGRYEWTAFNAAASIPVLVPCADFGAFYRRVQDDQAPVAIGCQSVLQLGQAEFRTFERIQVAASAGHATVLRSLTRPGHYLLVPDRYRLGRFGADAGDRAYHPQLLLTSVLDSDTAALRAVLAATLEADVPPSVRTAIVDELHDLSPQVVLDLPWTAGQPQVVNLAVPGHGEVECVPTPTGFSVVLTLDVSDFLVVRAMLESAGLTGGATLTLPDGQTVSSTLNLGLSQVTGPYSAGPVSIARDGGSVELVNRIGSRVSVTALRAPGGAKVPVGEVLEPGAKTRVAAATPADGEYDVVCVAESGRDTLDEVRVYVEDLEVEVVFALSGSLGSATAVEVATTFLDRPDAHPIVLTGSHKQESRRYLMPLTAYVADPTLRFTSTAVAGDGTRTSSDPVTWALRRQGAVIPVSVPAPPN